MIMFSLFKPLSAAGNSDSLSAPSFFFLLPSTYLQIWRL